MELAELLKRKARRLQSRRIYGLVFRLCMPAIMMQLATFAMQYIDAAMVGSLGASASVAVSVVFFVDLDNDRSPLCHNNGVSVQIAQAVGTNDVTLAKKFFVKDC